jgi:hypothetical protein
MKLTLQLSAAGGVRHLFGHGIFTKRELETLAEFSLSMQESSTRSTSLNQRRDFH